MTQKEIKCTFEEYASIEDLNAEDRELAGEAILAMQGAYAPYSHFHVGAAVRMSNGQIVRGANQENAAFPSGLCAERTAMFAAGARYPDKEMRGIALAGGDLPFESICVRLFSRSGALMSPELLDAISALMPSASAMPLRSHQNCGLISRQTDTGKRYLRQLAARLSMPSDLPQIKKLRIAIDCANGAASEYAEALFRHLGAEVLLLHYTPDGININRDCGVQSMKSLISFVKDYNCHAGFALDGDGGRCLAVDETGELLNGDRMLAILCEDKLEQQKSTGGSTPHVMERGIAATVMSNLGFLRYAKERGIPVHITQPAQQFVLDKMRNFGLAFGGDGSGYLYFDDTPAPDGLLTAARIVQVMQRSGKPLSQLSSVMEHDPQVAVSVRIPHYWREIWKNDPQISRFIAACEDELGTEGRILVRERRDDASIRIMLEGRDFRRINSYAFAIEEAIKSRTK